MFFSLTFAVIATPDLIRGKQSRADDHSNEIAASRFALLAMTAGY
jgi:hypothetical protein